MEGEAQMQTIKLIIDALKGVIVCSHQYGVVFTAIIMMAGRFS